MIKRVVSLFQPCPLEESAWLGLESFAEVEITSEDPAYPIEAALGAQATSTDQGWRAPKPGVQLVRLIFRERQRLCRILLSFNERERERTQEFLLRWSPDGSVYRELLRQQQSVPDVSLGGGQCFDPRFDRTKQGQRRVVAPDEAIDGRTMCGSDRSPEGGRVGTVGPQRPAADVRRPHRVGPPCQDTARWARSDASLLRIMDFCKVVPSPKGQGEEFEKLQYSVK